MNIALTGKMGAGKDTIANLIADILRQPTVLMSFAGGLKEEFHRLFPHIKEHEKPRKEYQYFGQAMRRIDSDIWVKRLERMYQQVPNHNVIITDVRQENEFNWCKANGFYTIEVIAAPSLRIDRMVKRGDRFSILDLSHETELNDFDTDDVIYNDGDFAYLRAEVEKIVLPLSRRASTWSEIKD